MTSFEYLDAGMRTQLVELMDGDAEMIIDLIDTLVESTPELMEALATHLNAGQPDGFREAAHALKGSHLQLGATDFAARCQELENLGRAGDLSGADPLYAQLLLEHEKVVMALESWKENLATT